MDVGWRILRVDRFSLAARHDRAPSILSRTHWLLGRPVETTARIRDPRTSAVAAAGKRSGAGVRGADHSGRQFRVPAGDRGERRRSCRAVSQVTRARRCGELPLSYSVALARKRATDQKSWRLVTPSAAERSAIVIKKNTNSLIHGIGAGRNRVCSEFQCIVPKSPIVIRKFTRYGCSTRSCAASGTANKPRNATNSAVY